MRRTRRLAGDRSSGWDFMTTSGLIIGKHGTKGWMNGKISPNGEVGKESHLAPG